MMVGMTPVLREHLDVTLSRTHHNLNTHVQVSFDVFWWCCDGGHPCSQLLADPQREFSDWGGRGDTSHGKGFCASL